MYKVYFDEENFNVNEIMEMEPDVAYGCYLDIKEPMSSAYGKIGHVNKPSRQEFMDAKYKRKNFAKDYLMKGKKW